MSKNQKILIIALTSLCITNFSSLASEDRRIKQLEEQQQALTPYMVMDGQAARNAEDQYKQLQWQIDEIRESQRKYEHNSNSDKK